LKFSAHILCGKLQCPVQFYSAEKSRSAINSVRNCKIFIYPVLLVLLLLYIIEFDNKDQRTQHLRTCHSRCSSVWL